MKQLLVIAMLLAACAAQTAPTPEKPKPTPITAAEHKALVDAADQARARQLKLERSRIVLAQTMVHADAAAKTATLQLQLAQVNAEIATLKLQSELGAANEEVQALLTAAKKAHGAEGCDPAGNDWKCPEPPPPPKPVTMCGTKPCGEGK